MAMTRDDLIQLAEEAGASFETAESMFLFAHLVIADFLARTGQYVTNDASQEAVIKKAVAPWKDAVIDQLVVAHILAAEHEANPRKSVMDLLAYHADIAVDPRVSEAACKLIEDEREACAALKQDALEIFDGPETPQAVRDAIEWYANAISARGIK